MSGIKIKDVADYLETIAPLPHQESYDNAGLLTGDPNEDVTGILVSLDCTEEVVAEALASGCNMIVSHHPIIFRGIKKLTGRTYVERTVISAIRHGIAIYAIHTNLDNVHQGVNLRIGEKVGLQNLRILAPKAETLTKLVTFVPRENADQVVRALHEAGAGQIGNYSNCSFQVEGTGTFRPNENAAPFIGNALKQEYVDEMRVEVIFPSHLEARVMRALRGSHPYEEVAYYLTRLLNENQEVGAGMIGDLDGPQEPMEFLKRLKERMGLSVVRHTHLVGKPVERVAVCGGAGSFLLPAAIKAGADVYISADFKYHEFFDAEGRMIIADIGHYESEVFTKDLLVEVLTKKFPTFAINFSRTITNPISYLK